MKLFSNIATLAIASLLLFSSCSDKESTISGTFSGTADGFKGPITAELTIKEGTIESATVTSIADSDFAQPAAQEICAQAVEKNTTDALDAVSGATYTSKGTIAALQAAMAVATTTKATASKENVAQDTECDIVIIGAGGAGLAAATAASTEGKSVIVFEKMPIVGGNTNYATGGLNASETVSQKAKGIEDSNEQFFKDTMKGGKELNDEPLVRTLVNNSSSTVDWLIEQGMDLSDVGRMGGSTNNRTHRPAGGAAIGAHFVEIMSKAAKKAGADIRVNNTVTKILVSNGKPSGVAVTSKNGDYNVKAQAVIVTTGGFGADNDMVVSYNEALKGFGTTNHSGATGDGIELVKPLNAAFVDMKEIQTHPTVVPVKNIMITEAVRGNGAIVVNREGNRFEQEMTTRDIMSKAILSQTGKTAFIVFDQGIRESLSAIEKYAKMGLLTEAKSLDELAKNLSISVEALTASVEKYNGFVESGVDSDFGRKGMSRKIETGPFYAVEVAPAVHHTMGGIKINTNTEVLDINGNIIDGLFAAGEVCGGIHGANRLGGNAVADIAVFGRIAGKTAAKYVK